MKKYLMILSIALLIVQQSMAQETTAGCKVLTDKLAGEYSGECKEGLASGKGLAKGIHKYDGNFKNGMPNGKGTYYFSDSMFYSGNLQDGIREGKGEMHYVFAGKADSVIKGFWSGDVYRGKNYKTYSFDAEARFDRVEIEPSAQSGYTITFETSSTTGSPNGSTAGSPEYSTNYTFFLVELISLDPSCFINYENNFKGNTKSSFSVRVSKFPAQLRGTLSNGTIFNLELYKTANWRIRLFINK